MHGIYLTATLTTVIAAAIFGPLIYKLKMPADVRLVWLAAAVALPLQPLAFYFVRIPLDHWLAAPLGSTSTTYQWLISLYAPLTEEPAKLVLLLIPAIRRDIQPTNFVRYALAIGVVNLGTGVQLTPKNESRAANQTALRGVFPLIAEATRRPFALPKRARCAVLSHARRA